VAGENSDLLITLYSGGFLLQIAGIWLIVKEIVNDFRVARSIRDRTDAPDPPTEIRTVGPGFESRIGGIGLQPLIRGMYEADSFRTFMAERLSGGLRLRVLGVVLFLAGASVAFAANLISAL
jgi:hypothetical protein